MSKKRKLTFFDILKGSAMGIAEVIPGVSGGTIAFITGIYERLLNAIKNVDGEAVKMLFGFKLKEFFDKIDGLFLVFLGVGMFLGIGVGVLGVGYLLEHFPSPVWAFFFGLIIASSIYIGRQVKVWNGVPIVTLILGFAIALGVTFISPAEGSSNLLWVFICGMIAISALILPGVSGSFILLLMGMYTVVRSAAEKVLLDQELSSVVLIAVFMAGCIVGLLSFARIMSFAFKNYKEATLALLTGFMLGSLRKIWPWRNTKTVLDKDTGVLIEWTDSSRVITEEMQIISEANVFPAQFNGEPMIALVIACAVVGFALIFIFDLVDRRRQD